MTTPPTTPGPSLEEIRSGAFVPGRNADRAVLAAKHAHIRDPHVAPINALADRVADAEGIYRGLVPYVDPQLGGVDAEVLALLDNPSTKAEAGTGSGLLSLENDDGTARYCADRYNAFGLTPDRVVHWNVAPAPIVGVKNRASSSPERVRGALWLPELLELLPNLRVVLLMGKMSRDGWKKSGLAPAGVLIPKEVPHPSDLGMLAEDAELRLYRGLAATMIALDGPGLTFPPEPAPKPGPRLKSQSQTVRQQARPAALTTSTAPAKAPTSSTEVSLSDDELWGWWPTFEHYSSPGSNPWGASRSRQRVEAAIDHYDGSGNKVSPIARHTRAGWVLEAKRGKAATTEMKPRQAGLYVKARGGGSWGNQGDVPPAVELVRPTTDLDR